MVLLLVRPNALNVLAMSMIEKEPMPLSIAPVAKSHESCAHQLSFAKNYIHDPRRDFAQENHQEPHQECTADKTEQRRRKHRQDDLGPEADTRTLGVLRGPDQDAPVALRRREGRPAESADEGVAGTRRQTQPPRENIPDDRAQQRTKYRQHVDGARLDEPPADRLCHGRAGQGTDEIPEGGPDNGGAGREHLR